MLKNAAVQDPEANARKAETDTRAAELLHLDRDAVRKQAELIASDIEELTGRTLVRVVICGGAGSGKTTLAGELADILGVKNIDFDEYVPGGFTEDKTEYERRFNKALYEVWDDVPQKKGWVIEHVEACNKELVNLYHPNFAVLVDPGPERISAAAQARTFVAGEKDSGGRIERGLRSAAKAKKQFDALPGHSTHYTGYVLKTLYD